MVLPLLLRVGGAAILTFSSASANSCATAASRSFFLSAALFCSFSTSARACARTSATPFSWQATMASPTEATARCCSSASAPASSAALPSASTCAARSAAMLVRCSSRRPSSPFSDSRICASLRSSPSRRLVAVTSCLEAPRHRLSRFSRSSASRSSLPFFSRSAVSSARARASASPVALASRAAASTRAGSTPTLRKGGGLMPLREKLGRIMTLPSPK